MEGGEGAVEGFPQIGFGGVGGGGGEGGEVVDELDVEEGDAPLELCDDLGEGEGVGGPVLADYEEVFAEGGREVVDEEGLEGEAVVFYGVQAEA